MDQLTSRKRFVIASVLAAAVVASGWLFSSEQSPFYWYFLKHTFFVNFWRIINIIPYILSAMVSGNAHAGSPLAFFVFALFQWLIPSWLFSKWLLKIPRSIFWIVVGALGIGIGVATWFASMPERGSEEARTVRFKNLRFGLTSAEARAAFGPPDLTCTTTTYTQYGIAMSWPSRYTIPGKGVKKLQPVTSFRWIYFHAGPNGFNEDKTRPQCIPAKWDTEIGFGADDRILWFNKTLGTTAIEADVDKLAGQPFIALDAAPQRQ